ncbi:MAG: N-acetyl-gamma-glutamyl-phosphate reductase [Bacteroidota bacterium]
MNKIRIGLAGSAGYTGGELIRLLLHHPAAEIAFAHSKSNAGKYVSEVHTDLLGETVLKFTDSISGDIDVLFLCLGHGESRKFLAGNSPGPHTRVIDLSQDFRVGSDFTYGLPELNREKIGRSRQVANPGCFATAIQLALLPLAKSSLLRHEIHVNATTGSTGAGQSLSETSHFSWRQNNLSVYKAFGHQHLSEIRQGIGMLQSDFSQEISFIPLRGSFTRGILATVYMHCDLSGEEAGRMFREFYAQHPFVKVSNSPIDLKQVVNTNKCMLHVEKHGSKLAVTSAIDNLLKGASGQAVQNMNLMFGLEETTGLKLKASVF